MYIIMYIKKVYTEIICNSFDNVFFVYQVVAHEIAHSWTGNLVTNRTWEHFWYVIQKFNGE